MTEPALHNAPPEEPAPQSQDGSSSPAAGVVRSP